MEEPEWAASEDSSVDNYHPHFESRHPHLLDARQRQDEVVASLNIVPQHTALPHSRVKLIGTSDMFIA